LKTSLRQHDLWAALLVVGMFAGLAAPAAQARARHSDAWGREHFAAAERMREALNGKPAADRNRRDYQRVLNAYRSVYMGAPSSSKADPSVVAVAETLVEMGRRFDDDKILHSAIAQYKFLRREYPGSRFRFDALFTIGEIYKDDLNDSDSARSSFQEFLRRYPHNRLADDAREAIVELSQAAKSDKDGHTQGAEKRQGEEKDNPQAAGESAANDNASHKNSSGEDSSSARSGRLARVTSIRHWSTPDYTRVAIDLEGEVKFSAERIARPARIYFDLRGTKLASTLVGKSFDVDDGFLKKVRVAQFEPGRTRVVLEVANLSEYDAFLLPNPYRLIIDIHGRNGRAKQSKDANESSTAVESGRSTIPPAGAESASPALESPTPAGEGGDRASVSASVSPASKTAPNTVVKKVVDADDEDVDGGTVPANSTKRHRRNMTADTAKNDLSSPLAADSDTSDSKVLKSKRNHIVDSPRRSSSRTAGKSAESSDYAMREATPTASGDRSLIRALGLKIGKIVIDPGHGGHDTGTIGPNGLQEKDLVLEVGRRLGKLLDTRLGAEVVYTRKDDTFIPLETRTAVANQARADLFVSIHANSSHDAAARGVETYYLNFTSSPEALEVAARENAVSEKSIYELQDLVKKIALKEKIEESREFASDVQQSLHSGLAVKSPGIRNRGVKKAPFIVLIGANMPSILAEISFVSNPTDEHRLATSEYRQRIAESLYRGIAKYVNGLSGVKMASKIDKAAGQ
jgi:N-acetylmuramoyl-L-alanine amidase